MAEYPLDLGGFKKTVSTTSKESQDWFDRGIVQVYGFNHEEAIRCFQKCLTIDSACAMAHYFIAYCNAPNYNNPDGLDCGMAYEEAQKALALTQTNSFYLPWEVALIEAQVHHFCSPVGSKKQEELTRNYANAMRKVFERFGKDVDIVALFAESLMMLAPWKLWTAPPIVAAIPETKELVLVLEEGLKVDPTHPALCHLYIHTMELSATPEKALPAADVLRYRIPGHGHLLHMASHIDIWVGHYKDAVDINELAVSADETYRLKTCHENEFYKVYRMHNYHFATWAAMLDGQFTKAMKYAEGAEQQLDPEAVTSMLGDMSLGSTYLEAFACFPWHVLVRFGKWEDIIRRPLKEDRDIYAAVTATSHYARGVAFAALSRIKEAENERNEFQTALKNKALEGRCLMNNIMHDPVDRSGVLDVAEAVLNGEVEYHKGNYKLAFQNLRLAVERDINLSYDEPWGWMMPARHALGALLLEQGELVEAESVYRDDLKMYKNNLWSLLGLYKALEGQGKLEEAAKVNLLFLAASTQADVKIGASCFCATKTCCD